MRGGGNWKNVCSVSLKRLVSTSYRLIIIIFTLMLVVAGVGRER